MEPRPPQIAIYALTRRGAALGEALCEKLAPAKQAELHTPASLNLAGDNPFDALKPRVAKIFRRRDAHIFITATGIAVRAIAPHLERKDKDPAVVVMDQDGKHVISLLSGHLGGANDLARLVADHTDGTAIITTATDTAGLPSLDLLARERGLAIGNLDAVKWANGALLDGLKLQVFDPEDRLGVSGDAHFTVIKSPDQWDTSRAGVWIDWKTTAPGGEELRLYPRIVHAGMGCRRGVPQEEITLHLREVLAQSDVAEQSLASIGTIEEKRDEQGLTGTGKAMQVPLQYFNKNQLSEVEEAAPSALVKQHMGVESVCEAAAILASEGRLITPKMKTKRVTCALAVSSS